MKTPTPQFMKAIRHVPEYLYEEEKAHFHQCSQEDREGHIYWLEAEECRSAKRSSSAT
jgi:hypothetical protein